MQGASKEILLGGYKNTFFEAKTTDLFIFLPNLCCSCTMDAL